MMTYTITSTRQVDETLFTTVQYNFDGTTVTVEIGHFMPQTQEEVIQNILNRANSEQIKLAAVATINIIVPVLPIGQTNDL